MPFHKNTRIKRVKYVSYTWFVMAIYSNLKNSTLVLDFHVQAFLKFFLRKIKFTRRQYFIRGLYCVMCCNK